jgi:hypothetical protein
VGTCLLNAINIQRQVTNNLLSEYLLDKGNLALSQDGARRKANTSVDRGILRKQKSPRDGDGQLTTHFVKDLRTLFATVT